MKKNLLFFIICMCSLNFSFAQDPTVKDMQSAATKPVKSAEKEGWFRGGIFALNVNQGSLSNWAAGGEQNTFGVNGLLNYGINYRKGSSTWDNYFDLALGIQNATSYSHFRKTDDHIDITSKYGLRLGKSNWYGGLLLNFNSQALVGYDYSTTPNTKISNFLTPGKILLSPGFDYRPCKDFSLFVSPLTARWILKDDRDFFAFSKFGVDSGKKVYTETGAYLTARYNRALNSWASFTSRLDLFSNYRRNPQNIDVLFNSLLTMKFNKWLATNLSLDILYDDDVIKKTQVKEILGLGITLKLK